MPCASEGMDANRNCLLPKEDTNFGGDATATDDALPAQRKDLSPQRTLCCAAAQRKAKNISSSFHVSIENSGSWKSLRQMARPEPKIKRQICCLPVER